MMEKEFVSYEEAVALKELGFDKPCLGLYNRDKTFSLTQCKSHDEFYGQICSTPLKQQVFRWFREKYNLIGLFEIEVLDYSNERFSYNIFNKYGYSEIGNTILIYSSTYEEAESVCIDKLIEIAKQQDK